jgi:glutaredoxin-related protein
MLAYFTFNCLPDGIYKSQVIDVLQFYKENKVDNTYLITFFPRQNFFEHRKLIKSYPVKSIVIPLFPGLRVYKFYMFVYALINLFLKPKILICRGPMAGYIALKYKKNGQKIIYDGRSATKAEVEEYETFKGKLGEEVVEMEKIAVLEADRRISVTNALIDYWKEHFNYNSNEHIVIPCLSEKNDNIILLKDVFFEGEIDEPILAYAGSTAPWQSFPLMIEKIDNYLGKSRAKVLLLTKEHELITNLEEKHPKRVKRIYVKTEEVINYLSLADYGLLIRNFNQTNYVSSPVKYAEYLSAGLNIIMTDSIKDYADFTIKHQCGFVLSEQEFINKKLTKLTNEDKQRNCELHSNYLIKEAHKENYLKLIRFDGE